MTSEQIIQVVEDYAKKFSERGIRAAKATTTLRPSTREQERHAHWMCLEIPELLKTDNGFEKANRWLGFVQGVLWATGIYSIDAMRDHNR